LASFVVRWLLTRHVESASPVAVAQRPLLRLLPVLAILLAAAHWTWTATIFIGTALDLTTLVTLLSFVMLSVSILGIAPAAPAICAIYLVPMWATTAYLLTRAEWIGPATFLVLMAALAAALWSAFYIVISGVRRYLIRGDEVDLLVNQLQQRNAEVETLRAAAVNEFSVRSAYFATASHDFRQRVHAMKLLAQSGLGGTPARGDHAALARLASVIEELESYMTDVLDFAKLERVTLVPDRQPVSLQDIFQQIDVQFEDVADAHGVSLRVRSTRIRLNTDRAKLLRVLENLVSNAIKFTRRNVLMAARLRSAALHIEVWDQGPGIPEDLRGRIFDAFYQAQESDRSVGNGVGLGLAIVKRLTEALGYEIQVRSTSDRGTLMRLIVPRHDLLS